MPPSSRTLAPGDINIPLIQTKTLSFVISKDRTSPDKLAVSELIVALLPDKI